MTRSAMGDATSAASPHVPDAMALLRALAARYAAWAVQPEPQDVYKLLYHAALGSEHAVADPAAAERWMTREVAELRPLHDAPAEPVVEPLGRFARVHLRPYLAAGGLASDLLAVFVRTAGISVPKAVLTATLTDALEATSAAAARGLLHDPWPWHVDALRGFFDAQAARGHPAVHHSAAFSATYRPAYRVVAADELPVLLRGLRA